MCPIRNRQLQTNEKIYALFPRCPTILVKCSQGCGKAAEYLENLTGQLPEEPTKEQTGSNRHPRPRPQAESDTEGPPPALLLFTFPPEPRVFSGFNLSLGHTGETDLGRGRPGRLRPARSSAKGEALCDWRSGQAGDRDAPMGGTSFPPWATHLKSKVPCYSLPGELWITTQTEGAR